jgi:hypothetical protein
MLPGLGSDWEIDPANIAILRRPDGSEWELGSGASGRVRRPPRPHTRSPRSPLRCGPCERRTQRHRAGAPRVGALACLKTRCRPFGQA